MAARDFWRRFRARLSKTVFASFLRGDDQVLRVRLSAVFDTAKRLSDFVGLVTRVVVCLFGAVYFAKLALSADNFLDKQCFTVASVVSAGLFAILQYRAIELIFLYTLVGSKNPPSKPMRVFTLASALVLDLETSRALWQVSVKLAANNPLLK
jgi:hypothetical protein